MSMVDMTGIEIVKQSLVQQLAQAIVERDAMKLRAEAAESDMKAAEVDAERYRWLREQAIFGDYQQIELPCVDRAKGRSRIGSAPELLDAAIDQARKT